MAVLALTTVIAAPVSAQHSIASNLYASAVDMMPDLQALPNVPQPCTLMFHGLTRDVDRLEGLHQMHVRIYNALGTLLTEESVSANIQHGAYDVTLTNVAPAVRVRAEKFTIGVSIDSATETLWPVAIKHAQEFTSDLFIASVDASRLEREIAETNERLDRDSEAAQKNALAVREVDPSSGSVKVKSLAEYAGADYHTPPSVMLELSVAGPQGLGFAPSAMMSYARGTVELRNLVNFFGGRLGLAARMMRSGTDFRYSAAGIIADVNNDGAVIATIGVAKYQAGTDLTQPYTIAPFSRIQYYSSPKGIFFYSEVEATVHLHGYLSGTAGLGVSFLGLELIAGYHYSMYAVPDQMNMATVNGFSSMINFAF